MLGPNLLSAALTFRYRKRYLNPTLVNADNKFALNMLLYIGGVLFGSNIGVDIGSSSIKAVQCGDGRSRKNIVKAGEVELPRDTVVAGEIRDVQTVSDVLRILWKENKFHGKTVTFGVAGLQTLVRQVELPWEPEDIFREALPLRVSKDLPVDPSEMVLDFHPLNERDVRGVLQQQSLVVGALNSSTENAASAILGAKMRSRRADYSPFALIRASTYCDPDFVETPGAPEAGEERPCQVVVDVGAQVTNVIIHDSGRPLFVRTVNAGSDSVTRALADQLQVSFAAAEYLKREIGLGQVVPTSLNQELFNELPNEAEKVAQQVINAMAGSLVQVSRESVEYYLSATRSVSTITRIFLAGGGVLLPGYLERISSELQAPAMFLNAIEQHASARVKNNPVVIDPKYSTAYGLAVKVK